MTSKELTELIHQNTRIILPEFGAFLVKDSGEKGFNPANVSFSPFLRYNDGMLEVYVAKKRGISKEDASKDVHEFVETLKNELLEKGIYEIEGLGSLKRDQRGSLSFSLSQTDEKRYQTDKIAAESPTSKKIISDETPQTIEKVDDKEAVWLEENKPMDDYDLMDKKTRKISGSKATVEKLAVTKRTVKASKKITEIQPESTPERTIEPLNESILDPKQEIIPIVQIIPDAKPEPFIVEGAKTDRAKFDNKRSQEVKSEESIPPENGIKKKKSFTRPLFTGITIVLLIVMVIAIRNYYFPPNVEPINNSATSIENSEESRIEKIDPKDKVEKPKDEIDNAYNEPTNTDKATKERLKKEDEQEEAIKNTLIKNAQIKINENKTNLGNKFHIIAGSFKNPDFAKKFMNEMNSSGYKASIVIQPSGMNAVTIGSYSTREEANEAMRIYKNKLPNLWILKK